MLVCAAFPILSLMILVVTMRIFNSSTQNVKTVNGVPLRALALVSRNGVASTLDILVPAVMVLKGVWMGSLLLGFDGLGSSWTDTDGHENV